MDSNMELGAQINPFSPELPLVWIFYHSVRNRTSIGAQQAIHLDGQLRTSCTPSSAHSASLGKLMLLHKQISDLSDSVFGLLFPQRQTIELIPITEVHYWYQGKTSVYYIYGTDHQVYVADYPKRYCCGCTIL